MTTEPPREMYWRLVDTSDTYTRTYEHQLPHGMLVRVENTYSSSERVQAICFVPLPVFAIGEPYR